MMNRIEMPPTAVPSTTPTRHAEHTDTRQALQRHEPEFERKKKDDDEETAFKDAYEDLTDVSVPALRNFLAGLLDRMGAPVPESPNAEQAHLHRAPASPQAAAAMQAYQTRATGVPAYTPPPAPPEAEPVSALDQAASGLDRATLIELIRELDRLQTAGITAITLEKGDGFLASIQSGITRARDSI